MSVIKAFYNLFWFLNENPLRTDQNKRQISGFVDSGFVKTCAELVIEHGNSEQNGNDSWRKSRQCSTENIVSNGAKSNAFKSATQKYSMLPNNNKVFTCRA